MALCKELEEDSLNSMSCSRRYFSLNPEISFSDDGRPEHTITSISLFPMAIAKCVFLLSKQEKIPLFSCKSLFFLLFFSSNKI